MDELTQMDIFKMMQLSDIMVHTTNNNKNISKNDKYILTYNIIKSIIMYVNFYLYF